MSLPILFCKLLPVNKYNSGHNGNEFDSFSFPPFLKIDAIVYKSRDEQIFQCDNAEDESAVIFVQFCYHARKCINFF